LQKRAGRGVLNPILDWVLEQKSRIKEKKNRVSRKEARTELSKIKLRRKKVRLREDGENKPTPILKGASFGRKKSVAHLKPGIGHLRAMKEASRGTSTWATSDKTKEGGKL